MINISKNPLRVGLAASVLIFASSYNPAMARQFEERTNQNSLLIRENGFDLRENIGANNVAIEFDNDLARIKVVDPTIQPSSDAYGKLATTEHVAEAGSSQQKPVYGPQEPAPIVDADGDEINEYTGNKKGWSKTLTRMSIAYALLRVVDTRQTLLCTEHQNCFERSPFLNSRPSKKSVMIFSVASVAAIIGITKLASNLDRGIAKVFLGVFTGLTVPIIAKNDKVLKDLNRRKAAEGRPK